MSRVSNVNDREKASPSILGDVSPYTLPTTAYDANVQRQPHAALLRDVARTHGRASEFSQEAIFRTAAPPIIFICFIAGLAVVLRAQVTEPIPSPPPGFEYALHAKVEGRSAAEEMLAWMDSVWPSELRGVRALAGLCISVLVVLRVGIWAVAVAMQGLAESGEDEDDRRARAVRVGRWEDGQAVSGSEILKGMFM